MRQIALVVSALLSVILFPFVYTAVLTVLASPVLPLLPLIVSLFADILYWTPSTGAIPFTCYGVLATGIAYLVRNRLKASIIVE